MPTSKHGVVTATWESGLDFHIPAQPARARTRPMLRRKVAAARPLQMPEASSDLLELLVALMFVAAFLALVWPDRGQPEGFIEQDVTLGIHRA